MEHSAPGSAEIHSYRAEQRVDPEGSCILSKGSVEGKHLEQRNSMSSFDFMVGESVDLWREVGDFFFAVIQVRNDGGPNLMS